MRTSTVRKTAATDRATAVVNQSPLWQLDIVEVTGHNLEARGREEVKRLLEEGWRLLHVYMLKYEEEGCLARSANGNSGSAAQ